MADDAGARLYCDRMEEAWRSLLGRGEKNNMGMTVCRHWMFERLEGIELDERGYMTGVHPAFFRNMDLLIADAKRNNIKLYLTFLNTFVEIEAPCPVNNRRQRTAYLNNVLRPVVRRYKGEDTIFAFDIFNEIESQIQDSKETLGPDKITADQARSFIRACASAIHREDRTRKVSSGSGWGRYDSDKGWSQSRSGFYKGLGLDFYDFHHYTNVARLPDLRAAFGGRNPDLPVFIGEFSTHAQRVDDRTQTELIIPILKQAKSKGYMGVLLWSYNPRERQHSLFKLQGGRDETGFHPVHANAHRPVMFEIKKLTGAR